MRRLAQCAKLHWHAHDAVNASNKLSAYLQIVTQGDGRLRDLRARPTPSLSQSKSSLRRSSFLPRRSTMSVSQSFFENANLILFHFPFASYVSATLMHFEQPLLLPPSPLLAQFRGP